jgi:serine/threonine-protein kinase
MGVVVAARHLELGELYAIKFLLPQALASRQAVDRFLREARASARLKGEHVAKVHDVGRLETGAPYMVMEFLAGSDLQQLLGQRGPLPVEEAATFVIQACEAIAEAHSLGIIHRDIKPANLFLIQRPNGTPCIKVLDFGISKQITAEQLDLTKTGTVMGSPLYMAPEQMARTKDADARSDIWAMGIVLYELLTAAVPFSADTLTEVVAKVLQEQQVPPSHLRPGLPAEVDAIVARCLQKRPEHRFQSMNELAAALRPLAGLARAPQPKAGSEVATQPWAAAPVGSNTNSTWGRTAGGSSSSSASRSGKAIAATALVLGVVALGGVGAWFARRSAPGSAAPQEAAEVAPGAAAAIEAGKTGVPAFPEIAAPSLGIAAPSGAIEAPATDVSKATAKAPGSPDALSHPGQPKTRAPGDRGTAAPLQPRPPPSSKPAATVAPAPSSSPAPAAAPKKPKHEGVD